MNIEWFILSIWSAARLLLKHVYQRCFWQKVEQSSAAYGNCVVTNDSVTILDWTEDTGWRDRLRWGFAYLGCTMF